MKYLSARNTKFIASHLVQLMPNPNSYYQVTRVASSYEGSVKSELKYKDTSEINLELFSTYSEDISLYTGRRPEEEVLEVVNIMDIIQDFETSILPSLMKASYIVYVGPPVTDLPVFKMSIQARQLPEMPLATFELSCVDNCFILP